jgi:hypothetical protein
LFFPLLFCFAPFFYLRAALVRLFVGIVIEYFTMILDDSCRYRGWFSRAGYAVLVFA